MRKYLFGVLLSILGVLTAIYFFVGVPKVLETKSPVPSIPHAYGDAGQSLEKIDLAAFYFVPKDKTEFQVGNWSEVIDENLRKLQAFHQLQFLGKSSIAYRVYPEPIIGYSDHVAYDTLSRITAELKDRVLTPGGDAYRLEFARVPEGAYRAIMIIYEGVGHTGEENASLLAREFLTNEEYRLFAATFLAHEFYHTLGLQDRYSDQEKEFSDGQQATKEVLQSTDIMGRIRVPIEHTYLERETLKQLGV